MRLARVTRHSSSGTGGALGDDSGLGAELLDLQPEEVFRRMHQKQYQKDPPADVLAAFRELVSVSGEPQAERAGA